MIGQRLNRFLIQAKLGQGGMGTVWKARDELLGRSVAVKVLDETLAADPKVRRAFRREAEIAALLDHPAIVPVYEAGEADGITYLVMKLVQGETLAERIAQRLMPIAEALRIAERIAEALAAAHARGAIHRDISPRNVMLTQDGQTYVLDFGLARVTGRGDTSSTAVRGTPAYIAPETLKGEGTDQRGDLYSLGVVIYEMLTGSRPFRGDFVEVLHYETMFATVDPPSRLRADIGPDLDRLVLRLMSRDPNDRPASAEELVAAIHRLGSKAPVPPSEIGLSAAPDRSEDGGLARRVSEERAHVFLAILPMNGDAEVPERLRAGLAEAARAGVATMERIHVVGGARGPEPGEDERVYARRVGANMLVRSTARLAGTVVRVTYALLDPARESQVAGGNVEGSSLQPFELEDRFVSALRRSLGLGVRAEDEPWRAGTRDPAARERLAQALANLRRSDHEPSVDGAIALLEGLLSTEGDSAAVLSALARAYLHKYWLTKKHAWESRAAQVCERAMVLEPYSPDVMLAVGELHAAAGKNAEALLQLDQALALKPDLYEAHLARGRTLDGAGRAQEAEEACRKAIALRPEDARGHYLLGLILFRSGNYSEAVGPWQKVTTLTPDNASAHRDLGSAFFRMDSLDEAMTAYRRTIEIRPGAQAYYNLGTTLFLLGRFDEAVAELEKAVALSPADPWTWGNLGSACKWLPGREARMREALERAVGLMRERFDREPGNGADWAKLSGWLATLGCREQAERASERALQIAPDDVSCMVIVARTLVDLDRRDEAIRLVGKAVEGGYGVEALRRSPSLRVLRGDPEFERILEKGPGRGESNKARGGPQ